MVHILNNTVYRTCQFVLLIQTVQISEMPLALIIFKRMLNIVSNCSIKVCFLLAGNVESSL